MSNQTNTPPFYGIITPDGKVEYFGNTPRKSEELSHVYVLEKIYSDTIFLPIYFGKAKSIKKRIGTHISDSNWRQYDICKEIKRLRENGISIRVRLIAIVPEEEADRMERLLIKMGRLMGLPLFNMRDGGFCISVIQYTLKGAYIKQWASILEASERLNITDSSISYCCKRKNKTAGGYIWRYTDDPLTDSEIGALQLSLFDNEE